MLLLLPPSETKRDGGDPGARLDHALLGFPELTTARESMLAALVAVSSDVEAARVALKLSAKQVGEVERNRHVASSPVMPSIDRYDGVVYDTLDAVTLSSAEREFAHTHVAISSALFGLTRALDPIPAYRLSADSRLPSIQMKRHWRALQSDALHATGGFVLDMRSEAYAALGPVSGDQPSVFLRVVSDDGGRKRALNHFNKAAKGALARAIIQAGIVHPDAASLISWAADSGIRLEQGAVGELDLVV